MSEQYMVFLMLAGFYLVLGGGVVVMGLLILVTV